MASPRKPAPRPPGLSPVDVPSAARRFTEAARHDSGARGSAASYWGAASGDVPAWVVGQGDAGGGRLFEVVRRDRQGQLKMVEGLSD